MRRNKISDEISDEIYSRQSDREIKSLAMQAELRSLLRAELYDSFIKEWFKLEGYRVEKAVTEEKGVLTGDVVTYCLTYARNLARKVHTFSGTQYLDEVAFEEKDTLNPELFRPQEGSQLYLRYEEDRIYLQRESILKAFRRACLLKVSSNSKFNFMDKILEEYFALGTLFKGPYAAMLYYVREVVKTESKQLIDKEQKYEDGNKCLTKVDKERLSHFCEQSVIGFPQVLKFLVNQLDKESGFKEILWQLVYLSRSEFDLRVLIASANAITVLNKAGENFSNKDLSGVRIPGADLSGAICEDTSFEGADCSMVRFMDARLCGANFNHANLSGASFGEMVQLEETSRVLSTVHSPDGQFLVVGNEEGYITLNVEEKGQFKQKHRLKNWSWATLWWNNSVETLAFSPDGKKLVAGSADGYLRLWDFRREKLKMTEWAHKGGVATVAYNPQGIEEHQIASGGNDCLIKLWDGNLRQQSVLEGHEGWVTSITYSPDGNQLVSGSMDQTVRIWDVEKHTQLRVLGKHISSVKSVCYHPGGHQLASSSMDGTVTLWDAKNHTNSKEKKYEEGVTKVSYSHDGGQLALGSEGYTYLWNTENDETLRKKIRRQASSVSYHPHRRDLVIGSDRIVELCSVKHDLKPEVHKHEGEIISVDYHPNGRWIMSGSKDGTVKLWDEKNGIRVHELKCGGQEMGMMSVGYRRDGRQIALGSKEGTVLLWDMEETERESEWIMRKDRIMFHKCGGVMSMNYSHDGSKLASGGTDGTVYLWNTENGELTRNLKCDKEVMSVSFSPDGRQLASGDGGGKVYLWDVRNGKKLRVLGSNRGLKVRSVSYSPKNDQVASGGMMGEYVYGVCKMVRSYES